MPPKARAAKASKSSKMAKGKTTTVPAASGAADPSMIGLIKASDVSPHLDILIGGPLTTKLTNEGKTLFNKILKMWVKHFYEAVPSMRRKMIPALMQDLMSEGCRFLSLAKERPPGDHSLFERTDSTRKIHEKIKRELQRAVKAYEECAEFKAECDSQAFDLKKALAKKAPLIPQLIKDVSPTDDTQPKTLCNALLPRDKTAAPLLNRNTSMLSVLSGTHSVDCLIGSLINEGVFAELPKTVETNMHMEDSKTFSVEEQADSFNLGMSHPQESLGRAGSNSFEGFVRRMPQMTPPAVKTLCGNVATPAAAMLPPMKAPAFPSVPQAPNAVADVANNDANRGFDSVSPSSTLNAAPSNGTFSNLSTQKVSKILTHEELVRMPTSWLFRLSRLEETVVALLNDNIDLRRQLTQGQSKRVVARSAFDRPMEAVKAPTTTGNHPSVGARVHWQTDE